MPGNFPWSFIVLTRMDNGQRITQTQVREKVAGTPTADASIYAVSARTGEGLPQLRAAIDAVLPDEAELKAAGELPVRMWIDRAFSVKGAGTVVTGTWAAGHVAVGMTCIS